MITDIRLQNFRSYNDAAFEFSSGVNIIVGPNASGKTNLLEALLTLARGSSYRAKPVDLVRFNQAWSRVEAHNEKGVSRTLKITSSDEKIDKSYGIDGRIYKRLSLDTALPTVLFEPGDLLLLTGRPVLRRDYLDDLLEQTKTGFSKTRRDYARTLAQRNNLLKKGPSSGSQLFAWDVRLCELGGAINSARNELLGDMDQIISGVYQELSGGNLAITTNYISPIPTANYQANLLKKLQQNSGLDFARGFTGFGPHREDVMFLVGGHLAGSAASRGEIRTLVLSLKVFEMKILEQVRGQKPLLLFDDVFSELDGARRKALTKYLKDYQTFITTTDADLVVHSFAQKCNIISITKQPS